MATFSVTIPDTQITAVTAALCAAGGYALTGNTTTDTNNARQVVINFIQQTVLNVAMAQARQQALAGIAPPPLVPIT